MIKICRRTTDPDGTKLLAAKLSELLTGGEIIYLEGTLGSGKTLFAQGLIHALGCEGPVISPTFVLLQEYLCCLPVLHLDLYRLDKGEELLELGLDEYIDEWIFLIEWANLFKKFLPPPDIRIDFSYSGDTTREIVISSNLPHLERLKEIEGQ